MLWIFVRWLLRVFVGWLLFWVFGLSIGKTQDRSKGAGEVAASVLVVLIVIWKKKPTAAEISFVAIVFDLDAITGPPIG